MLKLARNNNKSSVYLYDHIIKKSNELSMSKMNQGLTLNQIQLFAYAIFSTQKDGKTEFRKHEFEHKFGINQLRPNDAMDNAYRLLDLKIQMRDSENEKGRGHNVFTDYFYDSGLFSFKWNENFLPHILELKEKYIITDLSVTSKFKSSFSWILYDYLKAHYGYWYIENTKEELMKLFCVEKVKSYQRNTSIFKNKVLNVAIKELIEYTELDVWYIEIKKGRAIVGLELHWSTGKREAGATDKQVDLLWKVHDEVERRMFDYLALENANSRDRARTNIIKLKEIKKHINEKLTSKQASEFIKETHALYNQLQYLLENDGHERDPSIYFNWLEDE